LIDYHRNDILRSGSLRWNKCHFTPPHSNNDYSAIRNAFCNCCVFLETPCIVIRYTV